MERAEKSGTEEEEDLSWGDEEESEEKKQETETLEETVKEDENKETDSKTSDSPVIVSNEKSAAEKQLESDDWEKEFDIEMTEDEIKAALKNEDAAEESLDGWD